MLEKTFSIFHASNIVLQHKFNFSKNFYIGSPRQLRILTNSIFLRNQLLRQKCLNKHSSPAVQDSYFLSSYMLSFDKPILVMTKTSLIIGDLLPVCYACDLPVMRFLHQNLENLFPIHFFEGMQHPFSNPILNCIQQQFISCGILIFAC